MSRFRYIFTSFVVVGLAVLLVVSVEAAPRKGSSTGKSRAWPARLTWTPKRVSQTLAPGQTTQVAVTVTSNVDLQHVWFRVPGRLGKVLTVAPATGARFSAGSATTVTLSFSMPAEGATNLSGVVQVRAASGRVLPNPLPVTLRLTEGAPDPAPAP